MDISRRGFLRGAAASTVAAAVPLPMLAEAMPAMSPIFEGATGIYNGVIIRETYDLRASARAVLGKWISRSEAASMFPVDAEVIDDFDFYDLGERWDQL